MPAVLSIFVALLTCTSTLPADDLEAKLREKLAKDFVKRTDWVLDYDEARRRAERENKHVFAYFTRSFAP